MTSLKNRACMTKPRRAVVAVRSSAKTNRPTWRGENTLDSAKLMMQILAKASGRGNSGLENPRGQKRTTAHALEDLVVQAEVLISKEDAVNQPMNKLKIRVLHVTEKTLVDIMKTVDSNYSWSSTRETFRRADQKMTTTMMEHNDVSEAFDSAITLAASL